jgi:UDP-GlcNAc:undecaprenyl-phosphate GlcNAc-1-phosphate transferase
MDIYIPLIVLSFLAAFIVTPLIGRVASRAGFVDKPQPHKLHVRPMPLMGGLAIYLALCVALVRVDFTSEWVEMAAVAAGATMLMLVGLWDDRRGVAPRMKILSQVPAALLVTAVGIQVQITPWPALNIAITLFWFIGITNAVNLMDNMDGLAAGTSAVSALFFMILAAAAKQGLVASLAAAVTGASLGFLFYNISPAMIFMGDTGSLLLGFLLAVIGVKYSPSDLPLGSTWMVPIVVMGLPIFDTTLVTISRLVNRRPVVLGGTDHTSHRLARLGFGINRAVFTMFLASGLLGILAVFMTHSSPQLATGMFVALLAAGLIILGVLVRARPIGPNNPQVVILAEDDQGITAIRAARTMSSRVTVMVSPAAEKPQLRRYLRALAKDEQAFDRLMEAGIRPEIGPVEDWHRVFLLTGKVVPVAADDRAERFLELIRGAHAIVVCRGRGWPAGIHAMTKRFQVRLLAAPGAETPAAAAPGEGEWNDPAILARTMAELILGARRKEKTP